MKYLLALLLCACVSDPGSEKGAPVPIGYSLGLGCVGLCLGDSVSVVEIVVGDLATATADATGSFLFFDRTRDHSVYLADAVHRQHQADSTYRAAISRVVVGGIIRLPDFQLSVVGDSCLTWEASAIPCVRFRSIR